MTTNTVEPIELCRRNARLLGARDIVVAGDPGSGNALVSNLVLELGFDYLDSYTEELEPDGSVRPVAGQLSYRDRLSATSGAGQRGSGPRFVKTHLHAAHYAGIPLYGAVLLVRDPRDTQYSAYHWLRGFSRSWWPDADQSGTESFAAYLDRRRFGDGELPIPGWVSFTEGWLAALPALPRTAVVRFEDLKTNPVGSVTAMLAALGLSAPLDRVVAAVNRSTVDAMRAREDQAAAQDPQASQARIMRSGKVGEWREWIGTPGIAERFADSALIATAARFGYDLTASAVTEDLNN